VIYETFIKPYKILYYNPNYSSRCIFFQLLACMSSAITLAVTVWIWICNLHTPFCSTLTARHDWRVENTSIRVLYLWAFTVRTWVLL